MIVMKFGGTSLGNTERIRHVAGLIERKDNCFVVCSAMRGVTDILVEAAGLWKQGIKEEACKLLENMRVNFRQTCYELFNDTELAGKTINLVNEHFDIIQSRLEGEYDLHEENRLLAGGEIITSEIIAFYLNSIDIPVKWLNALDFIRTGVDGEPSVSDISKRLKGIIGENPRGRFITQGYICLDHAENTANLKRGGSDYTATLAGAALQAEIIEIWTDIDGVRNNDPRIVEETFPVRELSFDEAAELAYFGAKILHPSCVWPASSNDIAIQLKNTMDPDSPGTTIRSGIEKKGITAVAAKEGITAIRIRSDRMLNAYGFLNRIFAIFEKYKTAIDVITTSEVSVSVTIDNSHYLKEIETELRNLGDVKTETGQAIVCVVGDVLEQHKGHAVKILESLMPFNVNMISYGGSRNNISIVVPAEQKQDILRSLNSFLFTDHSKTTGSWLISQA